MKNLSILIGLLSVALLAFGGLVDDSPNSAALSKNDPNKTPELTPKRLEPPTYKHLTLDNAIPKIKEASIIPEQLNIYGQRVHLNKLLGSKELENISPENAISKYGLLWQFQNQPIPDVVDYDSSVTDLNVKCDEIDYIERDFHRPSSAAKNAKHLTGDTPTIIANEMLTTPNKLFGIQGFKGSGKTVALTKTLNVLRAKSPQSWSIFLDMNRILANPPKHLTPLDIITNDLEQEHTYIFLKALSANPDQINILIDNMHVLPSNPRAKLCNYFKSLSKQGTGIALTSTREFFWPSGRNEERTLVEIPGLNSVEIEQYLTRHWDKELGPQATEKHNDYAKAVAKALEKDPIPRQFKIIKGLMTLLIDGGFGVFSAEKKFVSLREYATGETSNPEEVLKMLNRVKINKFKLMDIVTAPLVPPDIAAEHGIQALISIVKPKPVVTSTDLATELVELEKYIPTIVNGHSMEFMKINYRGHKVCSHPEYDRFFAAKFIVDDNLKHAKIGSPPVTLQIAKVIMTMPEYAGIAEYLNAAIMQNELDLFGYILHSISKWKNLRTDVLSNCLLHGFDEIAANVIKKINRLDQIAEYFYDWELHILEFSKEFGMVIPKRDPFAGHYIRRELIFQKNMDQTVKALHQVFEESPLDPAAKQRYSKKIWYIKKFPQFLENFVLAQSHPNIETYEIVKKYMPPEELTPEFANKLVHTAISHECMDIRIYDDLIELGATPSTININGETLIHTAVKNRNSKLLKFVINKLKLSVPIAAESKLLITALDTNPLNRYTAPGFWQMMEILVEHGIRVPKGKNNKNFKMNVTERKAPAYKLLTNRLTPSDPLVRDLKVQSAPLRYADPGLKSYRCNAVLSSIGGSLVLTKATLTEVLLAYRGLDVLSPTEQVAYERCIMGALMSDANCGLSPMQKNRIMRALIANVANDIDALFTMKFITDSYVIRKIGDHENQVKMELYSRMKPNQSPLPSTSIPQNPLAAEALQTRAQEYPQIVPVVESSASRKLIAVNSERKFADILKMSLDEKRQIDEEKSKMVPSELKENDPLELQKEWPGQLERSGTSSVPLKESQRIYKFAPCPGSMASNRAVSDEEWCELVSLHIEEGHKDYFVVHVDKFIDLMNLYRDTHKPERLIALGRKLILEKEAHLWGRLKYQFLKMLRLHEIEDQYDGVNAASLPPCKHVHFGSDQIFKPFDTCSFT